MKIRFHRVLPLLCMALVLMLSSCTKKTNLTYFSDTATEGSLPQGVIPMLSSVIKIEPNDVLNINVTCETPDATTIYNNPGTYRVSEDGDILFPQFGKIKVEGLTVPQLEAIIRNKVAEYVKDPIVTASITNFKVHVLGEVRSPGTHGFDTPTVNLLEALAKAGDVTVFGKRDNITVFREENGQMTYHRLNMNDSKSMQDPYFYLKQNDVIYVEPGSARSGQAEFDQTNSFKLSVISTVVSGASIISSLIIALILNKK